AISLLIDRVINRLTSFQNRGKQTDILIQSDRAITAVTGSNQAQLISTLVNREGLLLVRRRQIIDVGNNPDLKQMNLFIRGRIDFAMSDASSRRHSLHVAGTNH